MPPAVSSRSCLVLACRALAGAALSFAVRAGAVEGEGAVAMGNYTGPKVTLLAIDNQALPLRKNLCYCLSKPKVRPEPVLTPSRNKPHATDEVASMFFGTVLHDRGKFRLWYYGPGWKKSLSSNATDKEWERNLREGPICYAESGDGLHWTKPNLELGIRSRGLTSG